MTYRILRNVSCIIITAVFLAKIGLAQGYKEVPAFSNDDRVLLLAPHPDDESIGTAGVIQAAIAQGAKVKVVLFTNGENNELAFIVYEKRIVFRKSAFIHMGEVRRKETIAAMLSLGINLNDIIFLGYPDFGTMEILTKYWQDTSPYRSMLPRQTRVPYPEAFSPGAPYVGESILKDIKKLISDFKPTKIFVSHPVDTNRDHRALYVFLRIALWDLKAQEAGVQIFPCLIHVVRWPSPRGYYPNLELKPPKEVGNGEIVWQSFSLSDAEIKSKHDAIEFYKSQIKCDPPYLFTFARKNEIFGDYPEVKIRRQNKGEINWQDLGINDEVASSADIKYENQLSYLAYARQDDFLFIRLALKRKVLGDFGVSINLLGYSKKIDFPEMPKIQLNIGLGGIHIKDKKRSLFIKDVRLTAKGKELIVKIPLSVLGNPDYILSCVRAHFGALPLYASAWRVLLLE